MSNLTDNEFESILNNVTSRLTSDLEQDSSCHDLLRFKQMVFDTLCHEVQGRGLTPVRGPLLDFLPEILLDGFGIEIKISDDNTWKSIEKSIFDSAPNTGVRRIYVIFGRMGSNPEVRWKRYEDAVAHVFVTRTPHFVIDMEENASSLFTEIQIKYDEFRRLSSQDKIDLIHKYFRDQLQPGERLWTIQNLTPRTTPFRVRIYMNLSQGEKEKLRAEAALLSPQICKPPRAKGKYEDAAIYLLTRHGVFCPQTRDLFTAGSVALKDNSERGGSYMRRSLEGLQSAMIHAAQRLDGELFKEYWGEDYPPDERISEWLRRADMYAEGWTPSNCLFLKTPDS